MKRRNTNQKQIVFNSLAVLKHATTDELISYINKNYSNISLATIYRNLSILIEDNLVKKISFEDKEVYETVKEEHYHFECLKCGEVIDIKPDFIKIDKIYKYEDNIISNIGLILYGICKNCIEKEKEGK